MATSGLHTPRTETNVTIIRTRASPTHIADPESTISNSVNALLPKYGDRGESDGDSRYFTASSGDEKYFDDEDDYNEDDEDEDDDGDEMCIMLDSDDDDADSGSLSGLRIDLKTLQAVSNMLSHYTPIIQRDAKGNPVFVAPPPPDIDITPNVTPQKVASDATPRRNILSSSAEAAEELENALQELENVIVAEEDAFLVDKMSELTEVMEKMAYCAAEEAENA